MNGDINPGISWPSVLKISGAYIAFLIGSGFATGQEAMQFFAVYGWSGFAGAGVAFILMVYTAASLMNAGKHYDLRTNEDVFRHFCGPILGVVFTWYTMILIVAVHAVMLAGAAATLNQAYGIPVVVGGGLMAVLSMLTLLLGLNKLVDVMGFIGPVIVVLTITIAIASLLENMGNLSSGASRVTELDVLKASPHWFSSGLIYVGLTLLGMASFFPSVGAMTRNDGEIKASAVCGPTLFIVAMWLVIAALLSSIDMVYQTDVPIMAIANDVLPLYGSIFAIVIFLGIFTTVTPLMWTVCSRFATEGTLRYRALVIGLTCVGFLGATVLPFGQLLNIIYPSVGYMGFLFLICEIFSDVRRRFFLSEKEA